MFPTLSAVLWLPVYNFQLIWLHKELELPHVSTATSTSVCCVLPGRMRDASALPLLYSSLKIAHLSLPSTARLTSVLSQSRYIIQIVLLLFGHFSTALLGRQWDHQPYLPYMVTHGIDWQQTTPPRVHLASSRSLDSEPSNLPWWSTAFKIKATWNL